MISLVSLITYDTFTLLRFKKLFQVKRDHWIYYIIAIAINAITTAAAIHGWIQGSLYIWCLYHL